MWGDVWIDLEIFTYIGISLISINLIIFLFAKLKDVIEVFK